MARRRAIASGSLQASILRAEGNIRLITMATESLDERTANSTFEAGEDVVVRQKGPNINAKRNNIETLARQVAETRSGIRSLVIDINRDRTFVDLDVGIEYTGGKVKVVRDGKLAKDKDGKLV
ncbi:hypothetical protein C8R44DRAFT_980110 [Mycena epipterygia]|nr:hypothetical protein C8R44DRAFT_980110 [Mycena epipterygia]